MIEWNLNPIVFSFGYFRVNYYLILMIIAFVIGYYILIRLAKERDLDENVIHEFSIYALLGIIIGARLFHVFVYSYDYFIENPIKIFYIWNGGLASHGAVIGGALAAFIYTRIKKISFYEIADILAISVTLGAVFIRIGNFTNSEIVGRITEVPWCVKFLLADPVNCRHPSQVYEALKNLFLFVFLFKIRNYKLPKGFLFWLSIFGFSLLRFFVEFYKERLLLGYEYIFDIGQYISLILIVISGIILIFIWKKYKKDIYSKH